MSYVKGDDQGAGAFKRDVACQDAFVVVERPRKRCGMTPCCGRGSWDDVSDLLC